MTGSRLTCPRCKGRCRFDGLFGREDCATCEGWGLVALPLSPDALEDTGIEYAWELDLVDEDYARAELGLPAEDEEPRPARRDRWDDGRPEREWDRLEWEAR